MKLKHKQFRDMCAEYIARNGPATSGELLNNIRNHLGQLSRGPGSEGALSWFLKRDSRFIGEKVPYKTTMGASGEKLQWSLLE
tara:strand:+ start:2355 stop:2603 length:249 start_codon:yes stop_codon:yes gene_type:complete